MSQCVCYKLSIQQTEGGKLAEVYEFIDGSEKYDVNTLVVDFRFESDVTKEQAIRIIDRIVSSADNDNTTAKMTGHTPTMYAKTPLAIIEEAKE